MILLLFLSNVSNILALRCHCTEPTPTSPICLIPEDHEKNKEPFCVGDICWAHYGGMALDYESPIQGCLLSTITTSMSQCEKWSEDETHCVCNTGDFCATLKPTNENTIQRKITCPQGDYSYSQSLSSCVGTQCANSYEMTTFNKYRDMTLANVQYECDAGLLSTLADNLGNYIYSNHDFCVASFSSNSQDSFCICKEDPYCNRKLIKVKREHLTVNCYYQELDRIASLCKGMACFLGKNAEGKVTIRGCIFLFGDDSTEIMKLMDSITLYNFGLYICTKDFCNGEDE